MEGCQEFLLCIFPSLVLWAGAKCHPHVSYYSTRLPSKPQPLGPFDVWVGACSAPGRSISAENGGEWRLRWSPSPHQCGSCFHSSWDTGSCRGWWGLLHLAKLKGPMMGPRRGHKGASPEWVGGASHCWDHTARQPLSPASLHLHRASQTLLALIPCSGGQR